MIRGTQDTPTDLGGIMKNLITVTTTDLRGDHKPITTRYTLDDVRELREFDSQAPAGLGFWESFAFFACAVALLVLGYIVI